MTFTAIVPVRDGSKGLPGKNTRPLAGTPLWQRAVDQARAAGAGRIVVSTDIQSILEASQPDDVVVLARPAELAGDTTPMAPVILHAINELNLTDTLVLLKCTSPLREVADVTEGLDMFGKSQFDLCRSMGNLAGDKLQPTTRAFVVEKNT